MKMELGEESNREKMPWGSPPLSFTVSQIHTKIYERLILERQKRFTKVSIQSIQNSFFQV